MELLERFRKGDIRALSRVVSAVENRTASFREILGQLYRDSGNALRIGVTGPPGAGKSTLVNCLAHAFLGDGKKVGIIAIDPSSPFTGGALLGDRVRMNEFPRDGSVYFRSMASRGATGGLSAATDNASVVLDAFGFDIILIETVGVGQVELDVVDTCDVVVVVVVPESGDAVQTMKAGLLEIANIMVVNKSDRAGAETILSHLRHTMKLAHRDKDQWLIPIVPTEAVNDKGIDELVGEIDNYLAFVKTNGAFDSHRRLQIRRKVLNILKNRFQREFLERLGQEADFDELIDRIYQGHADPFQQADVLYARFSPGNSEHP